MARQELPTRDRIVAAAARLFHAQGIRAVSVDAVAEKAGVTKRTLYYHFRSKDDLIAAHLQAKDQPNLDLFRKWFEETDGDVADRVHVIFRNLAKTARNPRWKGCGFLRTSVELINLPGHPAVVAARQHKQRVEAWLAEEFEKAGYGGKSAKTARQIMVLMDGAFSDVLLHRDPSYMDAAGEAAVTVVRCMMRSANSAG